VRYEPGFIRRLARHVGTITTDWCGNAPGMAVHPVDLGSAATFLARPWHRRVMHRREPAKRFPKPADEKGHQGARSISGGLIDCRRNPKSEINEIKILSPKSLRDEPRPITHLANPRDPSRA
jgi:hypothetical protein